MLDKEHFENYKKQIENSLRVNEMAVKADMVILNWINQELALFPETLKDKFKNAKQKLFKGKKKGI